MVERLPRTFMGGSGGGGGLGGGFGGGGGNDPNRNNNNNSFFGGGGGEWDLNTIFSMKDVSDKTRAHLTRVYTCLLTATGTCALGMYTNATLMLGGFIFMILFMIAFAYGIYQIRSPHNSENTQIGWLLLIAFSLGFITGPGIHHIAAIQPELVTQAALYTTGAFGSFSAVSLFSQRRSFIFLGGIIVTMMQAMAMYHLIGWMMGGAAFGIGYLMCSLFITCLWIIFDTQMIVEQSERGHRNVAEHALTLFLDLFKLFIKILQVLNELEKGKNKKKN